MGVVSRRVIPVCGNLCFLCPSLRSRSRQPVKRYKKLIADILLHSPNAEPNDRKIGKLCEYVAKNPIHIHKITKRLEKRCYKDLRNEHFSTVKVILCIYRKLLSSCKGQMELFTPSLLFIVTTLLDQDHHEEIQILGCDVLADFVQSQTDSSYLLNLEGLLPKLCQLAEEFGEDERVKSLRTAGLRALAIMVCFMGHHTHIPMNFKDIVSVVLENYVPDDMKKTAYGLPKEKRSTDKGKRRSSIQSEDSASLDAVNKVSSSEAMVHSECNEDTTDVKGPIYWSRACLENMVSIAKEATTLRCFLEPLFEYLDNGNHWSLHNELASSVLTEIQYLVEISGENTHLLIAMLVKHLDHTNVVKQRDVQVNIIELITHVASHSKVQSSVEIIGSVSDLVRHLRKHIRYSLESSHLGNDQKKLNKKYVAALEDCILQLISKVGDCGPIFEMMAVMLENLPSNTTLSRSSITAVYRMTQLVAPIYDRLYQDKVFPEALFHQLITVTLHPDSKTRIIAHHIFSAVCVPSSWPGPFLSEFPQKSNAYTSLETTSSFGDLPMKIQGDKILLGRRCQGSEDKVDLVKGAGNEDFGSVKPTCKMNGDIKLYAVHPSRCESHNIKLPLVCSVTDGRIFAEIEKPSLRVSSEQLGLLFSSIWAQAILPGNTPPDFEAMVHTYALVTIFSGVNVLNHSALIQSFQLALSLRALSLTKQGYLQPSHRRSLFTLANSMVFLLGKAYNILELLPFVKLSLEKTLDPYLHLTEDGRLQVVLSGSDSGENPYGSEEDDLAALEALTSIQIENEQAKEHLVDIVIHSLGNLAEDEICSLRGQLMQEFLPDDSFPLGAPSFIDTPRPGSLFVTKDHQSFDETRLSSYFSDEESMSEVTGHPDRRTSSPINSSQVPSVDQLMDSVLKVASQIASLNTSSAPVPYDHMKNQCESLVIEKQQKMAILPSLKHPRSVLPIHLSFDAQDGESINPVKNAQKPMDMYDEFSRLTTKGFQSGNVSCCGECLHSFRLPPASPFDNFAKAAGW